MWPSIYMEVYIDAEFSYTTNDILEMPIYPWHEFLWWYESWALEPFDFTWTEINQDRTLYAKWKANTYTVSFDTNGWNEISPISVDCDTLFSWMDLPTPTRECNEFSWWENLPETMPANDITLKAIWNYTCSRSSWYARGLQFGPSPHALHKLKVRPPGQAFYF